MDWLSFIEELNTKNYMKGSKFKQHNETGNITAMKGQSTIVA
jgi:hypothetical protein